MDAKDMKPTRLDDSASIYVKERDQSEKEKWKDMNNNQRWTYFKGYYMKPLIAIIIIAALLVSILYSMFKPKVEIVMYAAIFDLPQYMLEFDEVQTLFTNRLALDPEKQEVLLDDSYYQSDSDSAQKFFTYIFAGEIDIFIGYQSLFEGYAFSGGFTELNDILPDDVREMAGDNILSVRTRVEDDETVATATGPLMEYGIDISHLSIFDSAKPSEPIIIAVASTTEYQDNAIDFIRFLLERYSK